MANTHEQVIVHLEKDKAFLQEVWAWFAIGLVTVILRFIVRIRTVGIRGFAGDDYVTLLVIGFYAMDAALVHIIYHTGANADLTAAIVPDLTETQIKQFIYGSQCQTAAWYSYTALIWCMKITMLFFYKRLTIGTWQNRMIKYLFWICGITYSAVVLTITFGCFPIQDNWGVKPLPAKKCTFKVQNLLVTVTLNVLTDAAILAIPIPMLWRLKLPWTRKLAIAALLSSGIFVIAAAIIRAVLTLGQAPSTLNINRWGVRETIIGLLTVNVPILRPIFTRSFWSGGAYRPSTKGATGSSGAGTGSGGLTSGSMPWSSTSGKHRSLRSKAHHNGAFELHSTTSDARDTDLDSGDESSGKEGSVVGVRRVQSMQSDEEGIMGRHGHGGAPRALSADLEQGDAMAHPGRVFVETTYEIRTSERDEERGEGGGWGRGGMGYNSNVTALGGGGAV